MHGRELIRYKSGAGAEACSTASLRYYYIFSRMLCGVTGASMERLCLLLAPIVVRRLPENREWTVEICRQLE